MGHYYIEVVNLNYYVNLDFGNEHMAIKRTKRKVKMSNKVHFE